MSLPRAGGRPSSFPAMCRGACGNRSRENHWPSSKQVRQYQHERDRQEEISTAQESLAKRAMPLIVIQRRGWREWSKNGDRRHPP
jgi:hypothetical protein